MIRISTRAGACVLPRWKGVDRHVTWGSVLRYNYLRLRERERERERINYSARSTRHLWCTLTTSSYKGPINSETQGKWGVVADRLYRGHARENLHPAEVVCNPGLLPLADVGSPPIITSGWSKPTHMATLVCSCQHQDCTCGDRKLRHVGQG